MLGVPQTWTRRLRLATWHRRLLAAALAALAVMFALEALEPPPPPSAEVLVAAHDLVPGTTLVAADVRRARWPPGLLPDGVLTPGGDVEGRVVSGAVRAGEPLTDVRVVSPGLVSALEPGQVATPVRLMDAAAAALLRPGDVVDVIATAGVDAAALTEVDAFAHGTSGATPTAAVVAAGVRVLSVPRQAEAAMALEGALVVLSTSHPEALNLSAASVRGPLSVVVLPEG